MDGKSISFHLKFEVLAAVNMIVLPSGMWCVAWCEGTSMSEEPASSTKMEVCVVCRDGRVQIQIRRKGSGDGVSLSGHL
jgi:hypothetical protein